MEPSSRKDTRARGEWEERIGQRSSEKIQSSTKIDLPPPGGVSAESGSGQVTLRWQPVENAVGYLVHRSEFPDGPFKPVDHGGGDVLAIPEPLYADTTGEPGTHYWYAVASIFDATSPPGELSVPVEASSKADTAVPLTLSVQAQTPVAKLNPVWHMLGSEHLSQLFYQTGPGGSNIGEEFQDALRLAKSTERQGTILQR
jgi:xylan 1,4-beta-xylosidase